MENKRPTARDIAISTLESKALQGVLGSNQILENQSLYGQLAVKGAKGKYNEAMNGEEVKEVRNNLHKKAQERGDQLGVYGRPSIGDYEVSTEILQQIEENKSRLSLKDLGEVVKSIVGNYNYDFEVPKELSEYVPLELEKKMQMAAIKASGSGKRINPEDALSEKERDALMVYRFLGQAYNRGVSLKTCDYFGDLNDLGREIMKKYKPKESRE